MSSKFELKVGGFKYSGWTSLRFTDSIEQLAPSMAVQLTDRWTDDSMPMPIEAGNYFSVSIDGSGVISGFIDSDSDDEDATSHTLSFTGRARTGDLVDCAAIHKSGKWKNRTLLQIAKDLCDPYGIAVSTKVDVGTALRPAFTIEDGETVFECLSRAARMRAVIPLTDNNGDLFFDRVSTKRISTVLKYGHNIKSRSHKNDWANRFQSYQIKAQAAGDDSTFGKAASAIKRTVTDDGVNRYRPTMLHATNESNGSELKKRATWERNVRAGRSKRVSYTVNGWRHSQGLWSPNTLVRVIDPRIHTDAELLISTVSLVRDNRGELAILELSIPEAFGVEPLPAQKKRTGKKDDFWSNLKGEANTLLGDS